MNAVPDIQTVTVRRRSAHFLLVLPALLLFFVNPATSAYIPPCPFRYATGMHCPGCGSLRAAHALLHGDAVTAFQYNPLLFIVLGVFVLWRPLRRALHGRGIQTKRMESRAVSAMPWIIIAYWLLRNIPMFPFSLLGPLIPV